MIKFDKKLLKEYLLEQTLLSDDNYDIEEITSCKMIKNESGNIMISIILKFSINGGKEWYIDNIDINYNIYNNFLLRKRKDKINKIKNRCTI